MVVPGGRRAYGPAMSVPSSDPFPPSPEQPPPYGQQPYRAPPAYGPPAYGQQPYGAQPAYGQHFGGPYGPQGQDVLWSVLSHLSLFVFSLFGPLVLYLVFKDSSPFVRQHAAEALNFHLTLLVASIVSAILVIVLIGLFMLLALAVFGTVMAIIAAVAAGNGKPYRYPLTIHFVS